MPTLSDGINTTTPVRSCKSQAGGTGCCADLVVAVGRQQLDYSTGDGLGYRMLTLDVSESRSLQHYPFDRYTFRGVVQATVASQLSKLYALAVLNLTAAADTTLSPEARAGFEEWLLAAQAKVGRSAALGLDADVQEFVNNIDLRLDIEPALSGWSVTQAELKQVTEKSIERNLAAIKGQSTPEQEFVVLEFTLTYERDTFTKFFAIFLVVNMFMMSVYMLVCALDYVVIRPREVWPEVLGYAVALLFALPFIRLLMDAPFGRWVVEATYTARSHASAWQQLLSVPMCAC